MLVGKLHTAVIVVYVTMEHIHRLVFVKEFVKTFEPLVRVASRHITVSFCGGVGNEDVKSAAEHQTRCKLDYPAVHFTLGKHCFAVPLISDASAKPEKSDPLILEYPSVDALGAKRRIGEI